MPRSLALAALAFALVVSFTPIPVAAQTVPDLLVAPQASSAAARRGGTARRSRKARIDVAALNSATLRLQLFDDIQLTVNRRSLSRPGVDKLVWVGDGDNGAQVVLTMVRGVVTGTIFADNRTFEIAIDPDGQYSVAELDSGAFPTDDPQSDEARFEVLDVPTGVAGDEFVSSAVASTSVRIDVMIVWTQAAESAAGGRAAMESLALNSVANANLVYVNSGVDGQLNLVYAAPVNWVETPSSISTDLNAIRSTGDGKLEEVHTLRTQYGADVVSLFGEGYRNSGACGIGSLMSTVSTSFASSAFTVVDRTCAVGNLSYAHELGHNQGLQHDPANASGGTPSYAYAYGYQSPSGLFRTVMSYGGAVRIPYFSSGSITYNGLPTGTSSQDNARALSANIATVAAFKAATSLAAPTCTYAVSATSLSFAAIGGTQSVAVTAPTGCSWSTAPDAAASWVGLSTAGGSGNGAVTVTVAANTGAARTATVTIAGRAIAVSEAAPASTAGAVNVAAASAGATASASTTYGAGYAPAGVINGDRKGLNWGAGGGWNDATAGSFPDWVQVDFAGAKTITEVRVFSVQDNYGAPAEPTISQTFALYGVTSFTAQYWDGAQWLTVPGGTVTGNQNVWRTVTFPAVTTSRVRVVVNGASDMYSRLTEVEAYETTAAPTCTYAVSATSLAFAATGGTQSVAVTAPAGCNWSTAPDAAASWVGLSTSGGSGNGAVTVTVAANTGAARSATVTIAGRAIAVSEAATTSGSTAPAGGNVAAASAGATASASTTYGAGYAAAGVINGDRKGLNWGAGGGWNDATAGSFPDWLQVDFAGAKTISEVRVFSVQDNYGAPVEPTISQAFALYGVTSFTAQYWDGAQWVTVPGGTITGNQNVWRTVTFPAVTTSRVRVVVNGASDTFSRIAEIEAIEASAAVPVAPTVNVAAAGAGAVASASTTYGSGYSPAGAINGDRKGTNWGAGGGWNDATAGSFPDWLQVDFAGAKTISEVRVFSVQDNFGAPVEPTLAQTFSLYGVTSFTVQYWDGAQWVTVPGGTITGNQNVWRTVTFPAVTTSRIRVVVNGASDMYSRLAEVEAR